MEREISGLDIKWGRIYTRLDLVTRRLSATDDYVGIDDDGYVGDKVNELTVIEGRGGRASPCRRGQASQRSSVRDTVIPNWLGTVQQQYDGKYKTESPLT